MARTNTSALARPAERSLREYPVSDPGMRRTWDPAFKHDLWDLATGRRLRVRTIDAREILETSPGRFVDREPTQAALSAFAKANPEIVAAAKNGRKPAPLSPPLQESSP